MEQFSQFLVNHWDLISSAVILLISVIFYIIKKRPLSLDEFQSALDELYRNLPYFIQYAERFVGKDFKKEYVLERSVRFVSDKIGRALTDKETAKVIAGAEYTLEEILDCPTKKGGLGREETTKR